MRLFTTILAVIAISSAAGCAAQSTTRGSDTAVRAEARRISNARSYPAEDIVAVPLTDAERVRRAASF